MYRRFLMAHCGNYGKSLGIIDMVRCERCKCLCDPGDLISGICDDCREEEQREQEQKQKMGRMLNGNSRQMELEEFLI